MVSTRSGGSTQTKLEDFTDDKNEIQNTPMKKRTSAATNGGKNKKIKVEQDERQLQEDEASEETHEGEDKAKPDHKDDHKKDEEESSSQSKGDDTGETTAKDKSIDAKNKTKNPSDDISQEEKSRGAKDDHASNNEGDENAPKDEGEEQKSDQETLTTLKKSDDTDRHSEPIQINRAPVLTLFAACAAQLQHPNLSWPECVSLGSAVSSICAISKGRAIGVIGESNDDSARKTHPEGDRVSVLGFDIIVKSKVAYVNETRKPANEGYLKSKFGARYDEVKEAMQESLASWKGQEQEFAQKGFRMYERFRPGGGGWGQQSGLDVEEVKRAILR